MNWKRDLHLVMARSSRRMDKIAGRPKWSSTKKKCSECGGNMIQLRANEYVCVSCGLEQQAKY
ncbi:MAG: hypothetical protein HWN81_12340 [Candidatus Lokiarchaeota archaeon]|nr:hypothetical protein [Candidatus Lokiarchaeota archaeon]